MKPSLSRIGLRLLVDPWLIRKDKHRSLIGQFRDAARSRAPLKLKLNTGSLPDDDDDDEDGMNLTQLAARGDQDYLADVCIEDGIAILCIDGIIGKHLDMLDTMCGGYDIDTLQMQCLALMNRADVHTVLLHINSPGGAAAGVGDAATSLLELGQSKTIIAYCDEACSGAYWLACAASEIYAGATSVVGSISAVCAILDESEAFQMEGLRMDVFADGDLKGAGIEGTSLTETQRADIQGRVEYIGGEFKKFVKARRPAVTDDSLRGQWFYGAQGPELGLVDDLLPTIEHVKALILAGRE